MDLGDARGQVPVTHRTKTGGALATGVEGGSGDLQRFTRATGRRDVLSFAEFVVAATQTP